MHIENTEDIRKSAYSALENALKGGVAASMVLIKAQGLAGAAVSMADLGQLVRASLRRRADLVKTCGNGIFMILHETEKDEAFIVAERIRLTLIDYIRAKTNDNSVEISYAVASSSEGAVGFDAIMADAGL